MTGEEAAGTTAESARAHDPFAESDHGRFTEWLRERSEPDWTAATEHRFTEELAAEDIDDEVFRRYLVADYRFVETLTSTVAYAAGRRRASRSACDSRSS